MRTTAQVILAVLTGIAVMWITVGDVITRFVPGLPQNSLEIGRAGGWTRVHFSHEGTWIGIGLWVGLLATGFVVKRWGKRQLQLGALIAVPAALPLWWTGKTSLNCATCLLSPDGWHGVAFALIGFALITLVLFAKITSWRLWWRLVTQN